MFFRDPGGGGESKIFMSDIFGRGEFVVPTPSGASDPAWGPASGLKARPRPAVLIGALDKKSLAGGECGPDDGRRRIGALPRVQSNRILLTRGLT